MRGRFFLLFVLVACSKDPDADPTKLDGGGNDRDANNGADGSTTNDGGTGDGGDAGPQAKGPLFAFVGSNDGKIRSYLVDEATGAWTLKKDSSAGSNPSFLAFDPPRRRVVATDENNGGGAVRSFTFDPAT